MGKIYNKLVRDKIPEIIKNDGKNAIISKINNKDDLKKLLVKKIYEEVNEYEESFEPMELADILEVVYSLAHHIHDMNAEELEKLRLKKQKERGSFNEGIILEEVL